MIKTVYAIAVVRGGSSSCSQLFQVEASSPVPGAQKVTGPTPARTMLAKRLALLRSRAPCATPAVRWPNRSKCGSCPRHRVADETPLRGKCPIHGPSLTIVCRVTFGGNLFSTFRRVFVGSVVAVCAGELSAMTIGDHLALSDLICAVKSVGVPPNRSRSSFRERVEELRCFSPSSTAASSLATIGAGVCTRQSPVQAVVTKFG